MNASLPGVLSLTPGKWKGTDGNWSSFSITVGGSDSYEVLPSIGGSQIWLPDLQIACRYNDWVQDCPSPRGMETNVSLQNNADWKPMGFYGLQEKPPLFSLFSKANSSFGLSHVQWSNSSNATHGGLNEPVAIAAYEYNEYWLGLFGLNTDSTTLEGMNLTASSSMTMLKDAGIIGSLSYGYTAGCFYRSSPDGEVASLTLGGYDEARVGTGGANLTIDETSRELELHLSTLVVSGDISGGETSLLPPDGTSAILDSSTAQLWMPEEICQLFVTAFNLTWDNNTGLYLSDYSSRQKLSNNRANLTFSIGTGNGVEGETTIVLPFSAFDLSMSEPIYNGRESYFPLRNATTTSGNVIGRVFLQEAYIVVDQERNTFIVSPTVHGVNESHLVAIQPMGTDSNSTPPASTNTKSLSRGGVAGVVVSCLVLLVLAALAVMWWIRRRRTQARDRKASVEAPTIGTVDTAGSGRNNKPDLMSSESNIKPLLELDFLREHEEADSTQLLEMSVSGAELELMSNEVLEMEGDLVQPDGKDKLDSDDSKNVDGGDEAKDDEEKKPESVHELEGDTGKSEKPLAE